MMRAREKCIPIQTLCLSIISQLGVNIYLPKKNDDLMTMMVYGCGGICNDADDENVGDGILPKEQSMCTL